jgi:hypothetical protein
MSRCVVWVTGAEKIGRCCFNHRVYLVMTARGHDQPPKLSSAMTPLFPNQQTLVGTFGMPLPCQDRT